MQRWVVYLLSPPLPWLRINYSGFRSEEWMHIVGTYRSDGSHGMMVEDNCHSGKSSFFLISERSHMVNYLVAFVHL